MTSRGVGLGFAFALAAAGARAEPQDDGLDARFVALTQIDWVIFRESSEDELDTSSGRPLNEDRFVLKRARAGYVVEDTRFFARGELELRGEREIAILPYEAHLGARFETSEPERAAQARAVLRLGLFQIPFGFDVQEPTEARPVLERTTFAKALFPGQRDLGAGAELRFSVLSAAFAWMNGEPIGEGAFAGLDRTRMKDFVGRFGIESELAPRLSLSAGFSGLHGEGLHSGTPRTKERLAWNDGNEDGVVELSELSVLPGAPATPSAVFSRFALGADARLVYDVPQLGALELRAEIVRAKNLDRGVEVADPVARGRDLRELGWTVGVAQELTRYAQIAVRYDVYDPDADARRSSASEVVPVDARYRTWSFAASARVEHYRLMLEYDHRDNALGISSSGAPVTLADDSLTLRGEFSY